MNVISLLGMIWKALTEKDPQFAELFPDYDEYHKVSRISPLSILRASLISEWIKPNSSVLDVGCGEGFLMEYLLKKKNCKVFGIDVSRKAIEIVRSKGMEGEVRDIDEEGLGLSKDEKYDYILFVEVLEHLKYPHKILIEASKHVNEGVIVTLPNSGYIYWRLQMLRGYFPRQSFMHLHFWSINDFYIFLRQLGLRPISLKTELPTKGFKGLLLNHLKNLLAYQQCWLIAPVKD
jgi:methionine biosynthesis protein MetW